MNGISSPIKEAQESSLAPILHGTKYHFYQHHDLGLASLQNCEKLIFVVYKSCYSSPNGLRQKMSPFKIPTQPHLKILKGHCSLLPPLLDVSSQISGKQFGK